MILAVAMLAEGLPASAFEIEAGGVHEYQVEAGEQVAPLRKQALLDDVLQATWRERRAAVLFRRRQFLAQPGHRPIEMMQLEPIHAADGIVLAPAIRCSVGAADEQAMQDGEEYRPLQGKLVSATLGEIGDDAAAAGLLPQSFEDHSRSDPANCDLEDGIVGCRAQHHRFGGEPRP